MKWIKADENEKIALRDNDMCLVFMLHPKKDIIAATWYEEKGAWEVYDVRRTYLLRPGVDVSYYSKIKSPEEV